MNTDPSGMAYGGWKDGYHFNNAEKYGFKCVRECRKHIDLGRAMKVESFTVNGLCADVVEALPGQPVLLEANWYNPEQGCTGCIEQMYFGIRDTKLKCIWSKNPSAHQRGTYRNAYTFDKPGTYEIHGATSFFMRCGTRTRGARIVTVKVLRPPKAVEL